MASPSVETIAGDAAAPAPSAPSITLYVDEAAGSDDADGTPEAPLKTAVAALDKVAGAPVAIKVRKDAEWADISGAGLKKARKAWETAVSKRKKAEEAAKKAGDAEEEERRRLEESKKIKLEQDASLPAAKKVCARRWTTGQSRALGQNTPRASRRQPINIHYGCALPHLGVTNGRKGNGWEDFTLRASNPDRACLASRRAPISL